MVYDSRVDRHAETLGMNGHEALVLCALSERTMSKEKKFHYFVIRKRSFLHRLSETRMRTRKKQEAPDHVIEISHKVSTLRLTLRALFRLASAAAFDVVMIREAKRIDADLYICNDFYTLRVGAFMKLLGKRVIYDSHELFPDLFNDVAPYVQRMIQRIESILIRFADVVITVNEFIASKMSSRYGIPYPTVVMNCPETPYQISSVPKNRTATKTVLYSGTLWPERGIENIILACSHLRKGIRVVIRGEGPIEHELKELARGLDNCHFERPVPMNEVITKAAEADIGVIPYLPITLNNLYTSPNKLFEYLQAGLPVVGSDVPFIRKILIENDVGYVFNPYDPKDIARTMELITQENVLERMRDNVKRVRLKYSWDVESKKFLAAVLNLATGLKATTYRKRDI
jgi:glycosyltransferase involved in cell wall biosynthesis